jgi:predicted ATP-dependent endonuclease of OLD family
MIKKINQIVNDKGEKNMLDSDINIDLHIHTKTSEYKEEDGLVDNSTFDHIDDLLDKLDDEKYQISMFSFTDHNRFDPGIYKKTREKINQGSYNYIKKLLAGVEFDVLLETGKEPCHIITIFNDKNEKDLDRIKSEIETQLLTNKDAYYNKEEYENIIRKIGLDTILIVCQRKSLDRTDGGHRSLSDSTSNPFDYLKYGYFDALEFQKPGVEGILLNNLSPLEISMGLVLGSDCHDWNVYPRHDSSALEKEYSSSNIRCLPSFKGLLLALTSPKTRFKRKKDVSKLVNYLSINGKKHDLSSGLNAIIGENGGGKTLLLSALQEKNTTFYKKLINKNSIAYDRYIDIGKTLKISQGEITKNSYENNSIFGKDISYFKDIDHTDFEKKIDEYSTSLLSKIKSNINEYELYNKLANSKFVYDSKLEKGSTFYVLVHQIENFEIVDNAHLDRANKLKDAIDIIENESKMNYYNQTEKENLNDIVKHLRDNYQHVNLKNIKILKEVEIKNSIVNKIDSYLSIIDPKTTAQTNLIKEYKTKKNAIKHAILNYMNQKITNSEIKVHVFPKKLVGKSENLLKGFNFSRIAAYHDNDMEQLFYQTLFVGDYQKEDKILNISSYNDLITAIDGVTKKEMIDVGWIKNLNKFKIKAEEHQEKIFEVSKGVEIGNTLGEMSLVYYKFKLHNHSEWDIMIIDQPEDNISTPKIKKDLITLLDNVRDKKQVIFVTHNPLLVVNLDVDNVIYVEKDGDIISATSGCLENEDEKILEIIAEKMDGGLETIEKRLKYYGKRSKN